MTQERPKKQSLCDCGRNHIEDAEIVRHEMIDEDTLFDLADFFKLFGDSTRVKILYALSRSELCVGDIAELLLSLIHIFHWVSTHFSMTTRSSSRITSLP